MKISSDNYSLWLAELVDTKSRLLLWTQRVWGEKPAKPEPVYYVEHCIYVTEVDECTQKPPSAINAELVNLLRPVSYADYEKLIIKDVAKITAAQTDQGIIETKQQREEMRQKQKQQKPVHRLFNDQVIHCKKCKKNTLHIWTWMRPENYTQADEPNIQKCNFCGFVRQSNF